MDGHVAFQLVRERFLVNGLADDIPNAAQRLGANRHHDGMAGVLNIQAADQAVGGAHGNGANEVAGQVRLYLQNEVDFAGLRFRVDRERVVNRRNLVRREFNVHNRSDDTHDETDCTLAGLELLS